MGGARQLANSIGEGVFVMTLYIDESSRVECWSAPRKHTPSNSSIALINKSSFSIRASNAIMPNRSSLKHFRIIFDAN